MHAYHRPRQSVGADHQDFYITDSTHGRVLRTRMDAPGPHLTLPDPAID